MRRYDAPSKDEEQPLARKVRTARRVRFGVELACPRILGDEVDFAIVQPIDAADHLELLLLYRRAQDWSGGTELGNVVHDVLPDSLIQHVAPLWQDGLHCRRNRRDQRRHVARQRAGILDRLDGRINRAAAFVPEYEDQRYVENSDRIFEAR